MQDKSRADSSKTTELSEDDLDAVQGGRAEVASRDRIRHEREMTWEQGRSGAKVEANNPSSNPTDKS